ncbi:MAG TPA: dTMP kinase, partial [Humibacter sp.]|nr:dTMP kinase [Humibacter sp.]
VQDRYLDSSVAYQGVGRELDAAEVRELSLWATQGLLPDLTVLLDIGEADARARLDAANKRFDRLEAQGAEFHARVRTAFLALAEVEKDRFFVVNGAEPVDVLAVRIAQHVNDFLARRAGAAATRDVPTDHAAAPAHSTDTGSL